MRATLAVAALLVPVVALALPDDATLSQLLVGTWQGPRHETQFRADGTWILHPPDEGDNTRGKWRIERGRLIEAWRFSDESSDSSSAEASQRSSHRYACNDRQIDNTRSSTRACIPNATSDEF